MPTTQQFGCPVYDWDDRDNLGAAIHMVRDESRAGLRVAANCGVLSGTVGWVVWQGDLLDGHCCPICFGRPMPKLADNLTEAQLDGRACVRCGDEHSTKRPVEAWSELSSQLFECVDREQCDGRLLDGSTGD